MNQIKKKSYPSKGIIARRSNGLLMVLTKEFVDMVDGQEHFKDVWLPIAEGTEVSFENLNGVANIISPTSPTKVKEIDFNISRFEKKTYLRLKMHGAEVKFISRVSECDEYSDYVLVDVDGDCCVTDWTGTCKVTGTIIQMLVIDHEN